jgi:hypothetical protein
MFYLLFQTYVISVFIWMLLVSYTCCKCFILVLCMFAMVFKCFKVFLRVFHTHVLSVLSVFGRMLQVLHLNISKIDLLVHMLCQCFINRTSKFIRLSRCSRKTMVASKSHEDLY